MLRSCAAWSAPCAHRRPLLVALAIFSLAAVSAVCTAAEKIPLAANRTAGELTRVWVKFEVRGDLKLTSQGKETKTPLAVVGDFRYDERLLAWGADFSDASRAARYYDRAEANITVDKQALPARTLADGKRLVAVEVAGAEAAMFSPQDRFTRDDLDLVTLPGNSLGVDRILPDEAVAVGDSWKPAADAVAVLCDLDEVDSVEVDATLKEATDSQAKCELSGAVEGRVDGVKTKLEVAAKFTFDRVRGRISWLAMSVKEQREAGDVAPGVEATSRLQMRVEPLDESQTLADASLTGLPLEPTAGLLTLLHRSAAGRFSFAHDRRWHVIADDERVTVLRLLDDGAVTAQANITPLAKQSPGKKITLETFKADVERLLGKNLAGVVRASEKMNDRDYHVCRVDAIGKINDVDIQWIYYHVADKEGRGAAIAFTFDSKLADRFAGEDEALVNSLQLFDPPAEPAAETADDAIEQSAQRSVLAPPRK